MLFESQNHRWDPRQRILTTELIFTSISFRLLEDKIHCQIGDRIFLAIDINIGNMKKHADSQPCSLPSSSWEIWIRVLAFHDLDSLAVKNMSRGQFEARFRNSVAQVLYHDCFIFSSSRRGGGNWAARRRRRRGMRSLLSGACFFFPSKLAESWFFGPAEGRL
jgi:hypothetical protein